MSAFLKIFRSIVNSLGVLLRSRLVKIKTSIKSTTISVDYNQDDQSDIEIEINKLPTKKE